MSEFSVRESSQDDFMKWTEKLLAHIDEIHTTQKGADRIKKNLKLNIDEAL